MDRQATTLTSSMSSPTTNRSEGQAEEIDFIGEVESVSFGDEWQMEGGVLGDGGPDAVTTVGPQTINLSAGETLNVPSGTGGGNLCLQLIHPQQVSKITGEPSVTEVEEIPSYEGWWDWSVLCVVMGQTSDTGDVSWFEVLAVTRFDGVQLAEVGEVAGLNFEQDSIVTSRGFRFALKTENSDGGEGLDQVEAMHALADWSTGDVVGLRCVFGD